MRLTANETELYFDVEGASLLPDGPTMRERPAILFLHGGPGFDHACFKPHLSPLADSAQLVYLDLRGQGRSGRPALETCNPTQMADDVAAFCRALDIERPVIFGHSFGGFVALHLATRHPEVAGKLILANTAAAVADMAGGLEMLEARHGPEARTAAERMFGGDFSGESMEAFQRLAFPAYMSDPANVPLLIDIVMRSITNFDIASYYFSQVHPSYDLRAKLADIAIPTLIITGEHDWVVHPNASRVLAANIPHAELVVVPGTSHFGYVERPDIALPAIRRFVAAPEPAIAVAGQPVRSEYQPATP